MAKLVYAAIASEANIKRLSEIRVAMQKVADPRKISATEAENLIRGLFSGGQQGRPAGGHAGERRAPCRTGSNVAGGRAEKACGNDGRAAGKILASDADYRKAIEAPKELPDTVAGVLLRARVDTESWIGAGVSETVCALFEGREIFTPVALNKGINAVVFEAADKVLASGYLWEENRKQLGRKPLVVVQAQGHGVVVGFITDPNFRASLDGMNVLFLNAVFRGPAHARPAAGEE